ncbi:hypothetical protein BHM03_00007148 [Ensete ventricosum]|nr:hypothetical protein BHM03_00007148 [Ensete ventricosum]
MAEAIPRRWLQDPMSLSSRIEVGPGHLMVLGVYRDVPWLRRGPYIRGQEDATITTTGGRTREMQQKA